VATLSAVAGLIRSSGSCPSAVRLRDDFLFCILGAQFSSGASEVFSAHPSILGSGSGTLSMASSMADSAWTTRRDQFGIHHDPRDPAIAIDERMHLGHQKHHENGAHEGRFKVSQAL
jgi:hypothetical protein